MVVAAGRFGAPAVEMDADLPAGATACANSAVIREGRELVCLE
jgi:hypothetical protein